MNNKMREEFESDMSTRKITAPDWFELDSEGDYEIGYVQGCWETWQAAKQTPMVYNPTPRQSLLTEEAIEAGTRILEKALGPWRFVPELPSIIFHEMEAKLPHFVPAHKDSYLPASTERKI